MHDPGFHHAAMRPLKDLLPFPQALQAVLDACVPITGTEQVPLLESVGRVLAEAVVAPADVPPFDRAAMDGYAVRQEDTLDASESRPVRLRPVATLHAGASSGAALAPRECVQVATGSPLPPGADAVVPVERTRLHDSRVVLEKPLRPRENVSPKGSDLRRGETVLHVDVELTPARIAVAAATGTTSLPVWRRPHVVVVSTGNELAPLGAPLPLGAIYDTNGVALEALLRKEGAHVSRTGPAPDDTETLRSIIRDHHGADLLLFTGGSSAGEKDVVRDAVAAEGRIVFHGVQVKPGKPLLLGRVGALPIIGLPGYPVSCLSDAYLFVLPGLRRLAHLGAAPRRVVRAPIAERVKALPDRLWFLPVSLKGGLACPTYKESGSTTSLADADGYVALPAGSQGLEPGDLVDVTLL